jgi:lysophospholipase L1-like esterase
MGRTRLTRLLLVLAGLSMPLLACSAGDSTTPAGPSATASTSPAAPPSAVATQTHVGDWQIVALGDSVPYGSACDCSPYPALTGAELKDVSGTETLTTNDSIPGYRTSDVLEQLRSDETVRSHVRTADVLLLEIGANDVLYSPTCGYDSHCYDGAVSAMSGRLQEIAASIQELTAGRPVLVVLLDYWSVWLGGQYAAAKGQAYVDTAAYVTDQVNSVVASRAAASTWRYVDLRAAFKGPTYAYDETHYLAPDGDHPNAAGHGRIAEATVAVIRAALHP